MIILFLLLGYAINYYIDFYGIFGNNMFYQVIEPNRNFVKTNYI